MIVSGTELKFLDDEIKKNPELNTRLAVPMLMEKFSVTEDEAVDIIVLWIREDSDVRDLQS